MKLRLRMTFAASVASASVVTTACGSTDPGPTADPPTSEQGATTTSPPPGVAVLADAPSPDGGLVKRLVLTAADSSVSVVCDREGFRPFLFADQGEWVGCELATGSVAGPESDLADPALRDLERVDGRSDQELTVPGPHISVLVACDAVGFVPVLIDDGGSRVGCRPV